MVIALKTVGSGWWDWPRRASHMKFSSGVLQNEQIMQSIPPQHKICKAALYPTYIFLQLYSYHPYPMAIVSKKWDTQYEFYQQYWSILYAVNMPIAVFYIGLTWNGVNCSDHLSVWNIKKWGKYKSRNSQLLVNQGIKVRVQLKHSGQASTASFHHGGLLPVIVECIVEKVQPLLHHRLWDLVRMLVCACACIKCEGMQKDVWYVGDIYYVCGCMHTHV